MNRPRNDRLRVLVLTNLFPPLFLGGYEILCGQVAEALERRGHAMTVVTTASGPDSGGEPPVSRVFRILRLEREFGEPYRSDLFRRHRVSRRNFRETRALIDREGPFDVAFAWSQRRMTLGAVLACQDAGIPVVFTFNDLWPEAYAIQGPGARPRGLARWLLEQTFARRDTLDAVDLRWCTCISRCLREDLLRAGVPVADAEVIYQGIPMERFPCKEDPGAIAGHPPRVLYTGQIHPDKGVDVLVEAVRRLDRRGRPVLCSIVGTGPDPFRIALERQAAEVPGVTLAGRRPPGELPALYRTHDIFVFPSVWREPFGLTHLEAMASGTPVISTADGGQGEFLRHGQNAWVVPARDPEALADAVDRLVQDDALRRHLAFEGRRTVEEGFTMTRYVDQLEDLLRRVCQAAHP
ncbi:MAG TPA: glycosyltransferase family 4 protein [Myxococcota bacterium]|nr:glycosyltransferase family 4 protein [Myxococcota bacterium]HQK50469.1 glycosyltransferase family 4 protein [Myxococcota bacterium]